ncbi:MAG: hypothetical protein C0508_28510 [Cyanobacteria bacterium PR.023]|nr:hypothetical protein [Cyanobacteria bacterium PR.023]
MMTRTTGQCEVTIMTEEIKLYHGNTLVGIITNACDNGFDMHGFINLLPSAEQYKPIFEYFQNQERPQSEEPPFEEHLLENWFIEDEQNQRQEIGLPGIFDLDNRKHIMWRYF